MLLMRFASIGISVLAASTYAQDYPVKPIRIVTTIAGGASDFPARLIAQALAGPLGQPLIVENRTGSVPGETTARAQPDGYTMLYSGSGLWVEPLMKETSYDPVKDFSPVTLALMSPNVLVVNASLPVTSTKDLIALAKAKPGTLNYASAGSGSSSHLAGELFRTMAGVDIVHVPYKGNPPALNDLLSGQVHLMFTVSASVVPQIKAGKLKALAVTTARPSALLPEIPTVAASGVPGYEAVQRSGMFAPAKTSTTIINRVNREVVRYLGTAEAKERFLAAGSEIVASTPDEFSGVIKSEMARLGKVIKQAGIRAD